MAPAGALNATVLALLCPAFLSAQGNDVVDRAFEAFWKADSVKSAEKASAGIVASGASFADAYERLADGKSYLSAQTGELQWATLVGGGARHDTTVLVPKGYNPAVKYPVRVYLHGGVARTDPEEAPDEIGLGLSRPNRPRPRRRLEFNDRYIAVFPSGYSEAQWWFPNQMANLREILDRLKRNYNVDENRVHLMGTSDGGTGVFFVGLKDPTPWSVFFPLIGHPRVLTNPAVRADGPLFTTNLTNRPIYAVNGELDPLYPASAVFPYMLMLKRARADVTFRIMPGAGHDTSWWPAESKLIDTFEEEHPRDPNPDTLSWETDRVDRYNRIAWLIVDRLDPAASGSEFADDNTLEIQDPADFGLRVDSRRKDGRKIITIVPDTTAAEMGLREGDTIIRMDDVMIRTSGDMGRAFDAHTAGTPMVFEVERKGSRIVMEGVFPPAPKPPRREEAFKRPKASGRISVSRQGNRFEARTRGVGSFTLLLSPQMVEFDKPVTVVVNGKTAFDGLLQPNVAALLRYAARDNDRTMLFGAELSVTVPK
jgi:predicted esterase